MTVYHRFTTDSPWFRWNSTEHIHTNLYPNFHDTELTISFPNSQVSRKQRKNSHLGQLRNFANSRNSYPTSKLISSSSMLSRPFTTGSHASIPPHDARSRPIANSCLKQQGTRLSIPRSPPVGEDRSRSIRQILIELFATWNSSAEGVPWPLLCSVHWRGGGGSRVRPRALPRGQAAVFYATR